ncbi:hypothetical protein B0T22DRAFT_510849 [Podospora appendiculata]|uniref:Uncharacterized protein n=1 Tax=Podospora appendiculata TaxID=314037 RepID=A0AAE0X8C6_9PEZI|nr:hypothetical protein B0T22DRAFT_510849 [Podospora appendiculata]
MEGTESPIPAVEAPKPTESCSKVDETYAFSTPISPNNVSKRIYPNAEVKTEDFSKSDYDVRFRYVSGELHKAVTSHPGLQARIKPISYYLRMVGKSPETARPSIVVVCFEADFKDIKALLDERGSRLHCGKLKSRSLRLFRGRHGGKESPHVPSLELVYYQTSYGAIIRNAAVAPLKALLRNDQTWCGGVIHFDTRAATLGLTIYVDGFFGVMTVDHLFLNTPDGANHSSDDHWRSNTLPPGLLTSSEPPISVERNRDSTTSTCRMDSLEDYAKAAHDAMQAEPYEAHWPDPSDTWCFSDDEYDSHSETSLSNREELEGQSADSFQDVADSMPSEIVLNIYKPEEEWERIPPSHPLDLSEPYLDWALTKPANSGRSGALPSMFVSSEGSSEGLETLVALDTFAKPPASGHVKVYMISGPRGNLRGCLFADSVMIGSAPNQGLCEAWPLRLDSDPGTILKGECGSVIVDQVTNQVYGHIVGSGPFGNAYMVTLEHVLAQVETCFDAVHVAICAPTHSGATYPAVQEPRPIPRQQDPANSTSPTGDNMLDQQQEMLASKPQLTDGSRDDFDEEPFSDRLARFDFGDTE